MAVVILAATGGACDGTGEPKSSPTSIALAPTTIALPPATVPVSILPATAATDALPLVSYIFAPQTSPEDEASVRHGVDAARKYASHNWGTLEAPVRVVVQAGEDPQGASARASNNDILVFLGAPGWLQNATQLQHSKVLAHEFFHVVQNQLYGRIDPMWLSEGSAERFARTVIVEEGLTDAATAASIIGFSGWRSVRQVPPLNELETSTQWAGGKAAYAMVTASVDVLLDEHGGIEVIKSYFGFLHTGQSSDWRSAFTRAFGIPPADFYAEIAKLRA